MGLYTFLYENLLYRLYIIHIQPPLLVTARLSRYTAHTAHTAIQPYTPYIIQRHTASLRSGAGGGGGGAGGGAAAAVDVVDDGAGRFATAARARSHHLLRCLRTLTAAQILRARCFSRSLCSLRCRRAACAAVSGLLSPPACRSAAPREPLASVASLPAACGALA